MSELAFIQDVIYGLKNDYPFKGYVCRSESTGTDPRTGIKSSTLVFRKYVPKMILLPFSWRKFTVQKDRGGIIEVGTREILIDRKDIPGIDLKNGDYIEAYGKRLDVGKFDDYTYAYIAYTKSLEGITIG